MMCSRRAISYVSIVQNGSSAWSFLGLKPKHFPSEHLVQFAKCRCPQRSISVLLSLNNEQEDAPIGACVKNAAPFTSRAYIGEACDNHIPRSLALDKSPESLSDELFLEMFKNGTLPHTEWNHYAHVRMCYLLVLEYTKAQASFWKLETEHDLQNFTTLDLVDKKTALERLEISNAQDLDLYELVANRIKHYNIEVGKDPVVKAQQKVGFHATLTGFFTRSVKGAMFNYALARETEKPNSKSVSEIERRWNLATGENVFLTHFKDLPFAKFADSLDEWIEFGSVFAYYSKSELFAESFDAEGIDAPKSPFKTTWVFRATKIA